MALASKWFALLEVYLCRTLARSQAQSWFPLRPSRTALARLLFKASSVEHVRLRDAPGMNRGALARRKPGTLTLLTTLLYALSRASSTTEAGASMVRTTPGTLDLFRRNLHSLDSRSGKLCLCGIVLLSQKRCLSLVFRWKSNQSLVYYQIGNGLKKAASKPRIEPSV